MGEVLILLLALLIQNPSTILAVTVTAANAPVAGAEVRAQNQRVMTDERGEARLAVSPGTIEVTVMKEGFAPATMTITVAAGQTGPIPVALELQPSIEEEVIVVSATRTDRRVEDLAMRVEVLEAEEIEEKQLMTPGDIVMMLNEMGGLRVQATSPSLGAASVRVQGMRGRYTRFLSDGLPLFGDVGGLGLLQIPPTDLAQVEVIKGVASALYGAGALGGVVDLISRRAGEQPTRELLVNRTSLGGTDAVLFAAQPLNEQWSMTTLAGGHWQTKKDVDKDGWADLAGYSRAVVRPRIFWNDNNGRSLFGTGGVTWEQRDGTREALDTSRVDAGFVAQTPIARRYVATLRVSATRKRQDHTLDSMLEHTRQQNVFAEAAVRGGGPHQTWVAGLAFERVSLDPRERPDLKYTYTVPGVFAQDDVEIRQWLIVSASARVDKHSTYGTFVSPRLSTLVRGGAWNSRVSIGRGFFAPSALTDDTEAAGLLRLRVPRPLTAERGRSTSWDVSRTFGPATLTGTLFHYRVTDPVGVDRSTYSLVNLREPTITRGAETVATIRVDEFSVTGTYTYVRSREGDGTSRAEAPLTPRHSAGFVSMWEREGVGRAGFEAYFTGRQRLEDNPFADRSRPYVLFGGLVERRLGKYRLFVNVENLANVRQTNWNPILRPTPSADGRHTVDAWAPLDGRVVNGGIKIVF
jgi:iron complex outermembrane receptor protein